ncbi:hypothetical protein FSP39_018990 [Pinctada imbricata]|uniref:G-protein coupled receptors family 1 profile domain-containing protein n=1 Tax=Pinctada imbricata TaxID=66713 RepID=A0AA88XN45_PINIB|nr:hypothetical protein FSP39_018990 [Pinctada imbricata]
MNATIIRNEAMLAAVNKGLVEQMMIPSIVMVGILSVLGAPGNALVFLVYLTRWKKNTSRIFILALAVCDMYNCFISMPIEIFLLVNYVQTDMPVLCKISRFMTFWMNDTSAFILIGIAFDRFSRICKPFNTQMGPSKAKLWCLISYLINLAIAVPSLFLYGTTTSNIPVKTIFVEGKICLIDDQYLRTRYPLYFSFVIFGGNIIVDIIVIVLYSVIGYKVVRSTSKILGRTYSRESESSGSFRLSGRRQGSKSDKQKRLTRQRSLSEDQELARRSKMMKTTFMLFLVTLVFMLSFVPYCIIVKVRYLNPTYYRNSTITGKAFSHFFLRTYFLSSAMNPVIYSFLSERFRKECTYILSKLKFWNNPCTNDS